MSRKKNYKTPEERAKLYATTLVGGKIKYMHVSKRNNSKVEREETVLLLTNYLKLMGIETQAVRSKYTIRLKEEKVHPHV